MTDRDNTSLPIGVFDSGVGGLTVLKAIRAALPGENLIYLGDTARLPYGTKSPASIARYATQATAKLLQHNIKMLVVACNTASAVAPGSGNRSDCASWRIQPGDNGPGSGSQCPGASM